MDEENILTLNMEEKKIFTVDMEEKETNVEM